MAAVSPWRRSSTNATYFVSEAEAGSPGSSPRRSQTIPDVSVGELAGLRRVLAVARDAGQEGAQFFDLSADDDAVVEAPPAKENGPRICGADISRYRPVADLLAVSQTLGIQAVEGRQNSVSGERSLLQRKVTVPTFATQVFAPEDIDAFFEDL